MESQSKANQKRSERTRQSDYRNNLLFKAICMAAAGFFAACLLAEFIQEIK